MAEINIYDKYVRFVNPPETELLTPAELNLDNSTVATSSNQTTWTFTITDSNDYTSTDTVSNWVQMNSGNWGIDPTPEYLTHWEHDRAYKYADPFTNVDKTIVKNLKEAVSWFSATYKTNPDTMYCSSALFQVLSNNENLQVYRSFSRCEDEYRLCGLNVIVCGFCSLSEVELRAEGATKAAGFRSAMVKRFSKDKTAIKHRFDLMDLNLEDEIAVPDDLATLFD